MGDWSVTGVQTCALPIFASIRPDRPAAAFDIDSTILSNKPRQARIVREYGQLHGDPRLAACTTEAIRTWDLRDTMRHCGLGEGRSEERRVGKGRRLGVWR